MLYIGICEILKNWKKTLLMSFQIGLILFLSVMAVTTYRAQTDKYDYLREFLKREGISISVGTSVINDYGGIDAYMKYLNVVDEYHYVLNANWYADEEHTKPFKLKGYDNLLSQYEPVLLEGEWYTKAKKQNNILNVVIGSDSYGYRVGDIITLFDYKKKEYKAYVCGIIADEASYYQTEYNVEEPSIYDFYELYIPEATDVPLMFAMQEDIQAMGEKGYVYGRVLLTFKEEFSKEKIEREVSGIEKEQGKAAEPFEEIVARTEEIINSKMVEIMPVIIGTFILVTLSIISLSAIDTLATMESYSILFVCGMEWKDGMKIATIKSTITCIISIFIMLLIRYVLVLVGLGNKFLFEFGLWQMLVCVLVCVFMILVSSIMPSTILKKNQPVDILRDSKV